MDLLEFRVWDNYENEYLESSKLCIDSSGRLLFNNRCISSSGRYKTERSTGKRDIKGNLVFQGDITTHGLVCWNDVEHSWSSVDLTWNECGEWFELIHLTTPFERIDNINLRESKIKKEN